MTVCCVNGCDREAKTKGMCYAHYERQRRGDPLEAPLVSKPQSQWTYREVMIVIRACGGKHGYMTDGPITKAMLETSVKRLSGRSFMQTRCFANNLRKWQRNNPDRPAAERYRVQLIKPTPEVRRDRHNLRQWQRYHERKAT